ncbi:MAG: tRNA lysidine(34) synthetase TilS [Coriobacteriia bacterium]|nr:tRNA lysidine(34) synthetase TilS [Coriobacteriia bacterium]
MTNNLRQKMLDYIARHQLLDLASSVAVPVVVMLSGGGDSVALLHLLKRAIAAGDANLDISVLHFNHQLRGEQSRADEAFVTDLCKQLDLPLQLHRCDVAAYAGEHKLNLEDAGRILRYQAAQQQLDQHCAHHQLAADCGRILTAHTRDDRVENFFARAIFGAGLGALAGIAPRRGRIVRPLLNIDRRELREWLLAKGHAWREDPSNDDLSKTRAFIRARIVPEAEKLRPNFRQNLARTMDLIAGDDRLLSDMARGFARDFCLSRQAEQRIVLDVPLLLTLDPVMTRRTLRSAITETFSDAARLDAAHIEAIMGGLDVLRQQVNTAAETPAEQVSKKVSSTQVLFARDIPPGLRVQLKYATIEIARIAPADLHNGSEDGQKKEGS